MKKRKTTYELWGQQCGDGWNGLIEPLYDDLRRLKGTPRQIKEKFGALVFAYSLPRNVSDAKRETFRRKVERAEAASLHVCERCGQPSRLTNATGYLTTVCEMCRNVSSVS